MFMVGAVFFVLVTIVLLGWPSSMYLWHTLRRTPLSNVQRLLMASSFFAAIGLSLSIWWLSMRAGVRALNEMDRTPA
jgi:hypothetical protein